MPSFRNRSAEAKSPPSCSRLSGIRRRSTSAAALIAAVLVCIVDYGCSRPQEIRQNATSPRLAFVSDGDPRNEFDFPSLVSGLSVSPDGRIWVATGGRLNEKAGHLFVADSASADWKEVIPSNGYAPVPGTIERIHFFDRQTAIAVGAMSDQVPGIEGFEDESWILRTTNAGRTWDQISIPSEQWVYTLMVTADGHAWIGGSEGKFSHSSNYGRTWSAGKAPFDGPMMHTAEIVMQSPTMGFALGWESGSSTRQLRRTTDGGETWTYLDMPLDRNFLSNSTGAGGLTEMANMALVGSYLVIRHHGQSFITNTADIDWKPAPAGLSIFPNGRFATALVGVDSDGYVISIDTALRTTRLASEPLRTTARHIAINGSDVYLLDEHDALYTIRHGVLDYRYPMSSQEPRPRFYHVVKRGNVWWGATAHHLYRSHTDTAGWYRVGSLPMWVSGIEARNENEVILYDGHGQNYEFRFDKRAFYTIPGIDSLDVIGIQQRGNRWIAYGGGYENRVYENQWERQRVHAPWSRPNGFLIASNDSGRSWRLADEWVGEGIETAFLATRGYVHLVSYTSRFRSINLDGSDPVITVDVQTGAPAEQGGGRALYFRGQRGWLRTHRHQGFPDIRSTTDGGNTWNAGDSAEFIISIHPFRDGFLAMFDNDVAYFTEDSIRVLASPDSAEEKTNFSVQPIDGNRVLLEMATNDSAYNARQLSWTEIFIP